MTPHRSSTTPPTTVSHDKYPVIPGGRGATGVNRKTPVGADPLAVGAGVADTSAQMQFLAAKRAQLASTADER